MTHETEAEFLYHDACQNCSSSDARAVYDDGHSYCFACADFVRGSGAEVEGGQHQRKRTVTDLIYGGEYSPLIPRGLSEDTCRKFGVTVGEHHSKRALIFPYHDADGELVAQKLRYPNKDMKAVGEMKSAVMFGRRAWRGVGGKMVIVTEGELDAMSMSQAQENKWPVVSINNGAQGAKKCLAKNLDWLESFETVVLMFDMDEPGREAAAECAPLFSPGKCVVAELPLKDANDMLKAGLTKELRMAAWNAKPYRPDGIVTMADIREDVLRDVVIGLPWCFPVLTKLTFGRRWGEVYALGAGTGVGKTDFLTQQIEYDVNVLNEKVGLFFLEQQPAETGKRIAGKIAGKRFHVPDDGWTQAELVETFDKLETNNKLFLFDHFGTADWETIRSRIRFLAHTEGVRIFYLDHLTALAAASEDERKALEKIMAQIGGLVKELNVILILVSHLATPEGKPHEEGGRVMIRHFKGSRAIGFWCHFMFGLERNQQAEDEVERQTTTFRVLKDRYTGQATGEVFYLGYDAGKGRLYETEKEPEFGPADDDDDIPF